MMETNLMGWNSGRHSEGFDSCPASFWRLSHMSVSYYPYCCRHSSRGPALSQTHYYSNICQRSRSLQSPGTSEEHTSSKHTQFLFCKIPYEELQMNYCKATEYRSKTAVKQQPSVRKIREKRMQLYFDCLVPDEVEKYIKWPRVWNSIFKWTEQNVR